MKTNGNQTADGKLAPGNTIGHRFKPGESGNPSGRPVGAKNVSTILREMLEQIAPGDWVNATFIKEFCAGKKSVTNGDAVAARIFKAAIIDGESWAIRELIDRLEGKAPATISVGNQDGEPLTITFSFNNKVQLND